MRIMHLLKHSRRGNGSVHVAVDLACAQSDAGHDVVLVSAGGSYDGLLTAHGVELVHLPSAGGFRGALASLLKLQRASNRTKPDIMHAHMMSSAVLGFIVAKLVRSTLITTVHNSFDKHSVLMRLGRAVVAVSDAERRLLLSRGYPAHRVFTVLNGTSGSAREELPLDDIGELHQPAVISLCGLHHRKAVGDIVAGFAGAHASFPEWHLNIVGGGPERPGLEAQVADLGLTESVHFLGSTLTPRPLLDSAPIFVTASLADPCPLSVIEARTAGCAVIGTRVGGIPEILEQGEAGQLVSPNSPDEIANALRSLMEDGAVLEEWRVKARTNADYFAVARVVRDHDHVYREALGTEPLAQ